MVKVESNLLNFLVSILKKKAKIFFLNKNSRDYRNKRNSGDENELCNDEKRFNSDLNKPLNNIENDQLQYNSSQISSNQYNEHNNILSNKDINNTSKMMTNSFYNQQVVFPNYNPQSYQYSQHQHQQQQQFFINSQNQNNQFINNSQLYGY
jgi:hypothetical protein